MCNITIKSNGTNGGRIFAANPCKKRSPSHININKNLVLRMVTSSLQFFADISFVHIVPASNIPNKKNKNKKQIDCGYPTEHFAISNNCGLTLLNCIKLCDRRILPIE